MKASWSIRRSGQSRASQHSWDHIRYQNLMRAIPPIKKECGRVKSINLVTMFHLIKLLKWNDISLGSKQRWQEVAFPLHFPCISVALIFLVSSMPRCIAFYSFVFFCRDMQFHVSYSFFLIALHFLHRFAFHFTFLKSFIADLLHGHKFYAHPMPHRISMFRRNHFTIQKNCRLIGRAGCSVFALICFAYSGGAAVLALKTWTYNSIEASIEANIWWTMRVHKGRLT